MPHCCRDLEIWIKFLLLVFFKNIPLLTLHCKFKMSGSLLNQFGPNTLSGCVENTMSYHKRLHFSSQTQKKIKEIQHYVQIRHVCHFSKGPKVSWIGVLHIVSSQFSRRNLIKHVSRILAKKNHYLGLSKT